MGGQKVCRLCLDDGDNLAEPSIKELKALEDIFNILPEVIAEDTENDFQICKVCGKELLQFYKFFLKVKANQDNYKKSCSRITQKPPHSEEVAEMKKEIDCQDLSLQDVASSRDDMKQDDVCNSPVDFNSDLFVETVIKEEQEKDMSDEEFDKSESKSNEKTSHLCTICGRSYKGRSYFRKHLKLHEKHAYQPLKKQPHVKKIPPTLICDFCGTTRQDKARLREHIEAVHMKLKNATCHVCGMKFHKTCILSHMKKMHNQDRKREKCNICNEYFMDLKQHVSRNHNSDGEKACEICGQTLKNRIQLLKHIRTRHSQRKKFKCTICEKELTTPSALKEHMHACHYGGYLYECEYCDSYRGNQRRKLTSHYRKKHPVEHKLRQEQMKALRMTPNIELNK